MLKTLIYFPPEYRDLAHKIRENYIEHHHGEVDLVSETDQNDIEYTGEEKYDDKSILIKDTTKEEREMIVKNSMDCGGGCENCSSCWLGGGSPWDIYQDYIDGKREIREINAEYMDRYRQGRNIV